MTTWDSNIKQDAKYNFFVTGQLGYKATGGLFGGTITVMDILWSLGLIVFLLIALNHMAGGRASNVLRPVSNIASGLVSFAVRLCMSALGGVVRLLGGSLKPPGSPKIRDDKMPPGRTPQWDE